MNYCSSHISAVKLKLTETIKTNEISGFGETIQTMNKKYFQINMSRCLEIRHLHTESLDEIELGRGRRLQPMPNIGISVCKWQLYFHLQLTTVFLPVFVFAIDNCIFTLHLKLTTVGVLYGCICACEE